MKANLLPKCPIFPIGFISVKRLTVCRSTSILNSTLIWCLVRWSRATSYTAAVLWLSLRTVLTFARHSMKRLASSPLRSVMSVAEMFMRKRLTVCRCRFPLNCVITAFSSLTIRCSSKRITLPVSSVSIREQHSTSVSRRLLSFVTSPVS